MSMGMVNKDTAATIPAAGNTGDKVGNLAALHTTVKSDIVAAVNEVKDEQANKADMDIVADAFSAAETYAEGDYCTYEGGLYKFKTAHEGAWDAADVDQIQIAGELSELKNTLTASITVNKESGDTYRTMLARLFALVDFAKIKSTSTLVRGNRVYHLISWSSTECYFYSALISVPNNYNEFYIIGISASPSFGALSITVTATPVIAMHDYTNEAAPDALTIYY